MSFPRTSPPAVRIYLFPLIFLASGGVCAPAAAEEKAPEICDVVDSHAADVLNAFHNYSQALSSGDPTEEHFRARYDSTRTELLDSLHQEADAMDSHDVPEDYRVYVARYIKAERAFAKTLESNAVDSLFTDIDERNVAQHEFFARCNEAARSSSLDTAPGEGESVLIPELSHSDGE